MVSIEHSLIIIAARDPCWLICNWVSRGPLADGTRIEGSTDVCVEGLRKVKLNPSLALVFCYWLSIATGPLTWDRSHTTSS